MDYSTKLTYLIINAVMYLLLLYIYQKKKKRIDIGSFIISAWVVGSIGSVWYYTNPLTPPSYPRITMWPMIYIFILNLIMFYPFLRCNYSDIRKVETFKLDKVFRTMSIIFGLCSALPLLNLLYDLTTTSLVGSFLVDMYNSDENKADLLLLPLIKPLFTVIRHFPDFVIFLLFYNLAKKKINKGIVLGLVSATAVQFLFTLLCGSRGGILTLAIRILFYAFFMRSMIPNKIFRKFIRISVASFVFVVIGLSLISISRLDAFHKNGGRNREMSTWISQYMGEGIVRFDDTIWYNENPIGGRQTLPITFSLFDPIVKDSDKYIARNERLSKEILTVFYTYIGDFYIDFGRAGTILAIIILSLITSSLLKTRYKAISMFRLLPLCWMFTMVTVGITADVFRTYYTQLQLFEQGLLIVILYFIQLKTKYHRTPIRIK